MLYTNSTVLVVAEEQPVVQARANQTVGLFVWAVCGWLCRENCCAEKAAVQGKLLF
jgi:hypothetical protein